jgi:SOS response regulatory protein OraA/RecX
MENVIVEKLVIESKIRLYIARNKNLAYIKSKLFEKGFEKEEYEKILENNYNIDETLLDADYIKRKILDYKNK